MHCPQRMNLGEENKEMRPQPIPISQLHHLTFFSENKNEKKGEFSYWTNRRLPQRMLTTIF